MSVVGTQKIAFQGNCFGWQILGKQFLVV